MLHSSSAPSAQAPSENNLAASGTSSSPRPYPFDSPDHAPVPAPLPPNQAPPATAPQPPICTTCGRPGLWDGQPDAAVHGDSWCDACCGEGLAAMPRRS
jgi:hypothetical protein